MTLDDGGQETNKETDYRPLSSPCAFPVDRLEATAVDDSK
jgi:hypothetical protein